MAQTRTNGHDGVPVDFADPEVRLADIGDGLQDIIKARRGRIVYWPGRGSSAEAGPIAPPLCSASVLATVAETKEPAAPSSCSAPPELNPDLSGVYFADINGDGATDVLQIRFREVDVWFNEAGEGFTPRTTLRAGLCATRPLDSAAEQRGSRRGHVRQHRGPGGDFEGVIACDALTTHKAAARTSRKIQLAACWAHVHRRFAEAEPDHPEADKALGFIRQLYAIDDEADGDPDLKLKLRQTKSKLVLIEMRAWLHDLSVLTSTSFGSAARYAFDNWANLSRFVSDARSPLDNNATERGIRGPVVGRKNHYGSKSQRGTDVASIFYTLLETAKLNELNPADYLSRAVLAARRGEVVLPLA